MMVDDVWILFETQGQNACHNHPEHVSVSGFAAARQQSCALLPR